MKQLILLFAFLIPCFLSAQQHSKLELVGGLDYGYRFLSVEKDVLLPVTLDLKKSEKGLINYRYGLDYLYQINARIGIKTGFRYASTGYQYEFNFLIDRYGPIDSIGGISIESGNQKTAKNFRYWEIPLALRFYTPNIGKSQLFFEGGLSALFYHKTVSFIESAFNQKTVRSAGKEEGMRSTNLAFHLATGFSYAIHPRFDLFGKAVGRLHVLNRTTSPIIKEYLYSLGMEIGVGYKI